MSGLRWGFLSTARIGQKVWEAIRLSGNGSVTAVASRQRESAEAFIARAQAAGPFPERPRALGAYEELLADPQVDAVYIPLPTALRRPWVEAAAKAGKHIVCEKPCAASLDELRSMLDVCESNGVQFMDGVMFMHSERLPQLRRRLDDGVSVGALRRVSSVFAFQGNERFLAEDIRLDSDLEPYGCLGDLGWYCLRWSLWAGRWKLPQSVTGRTLRAGRRPASRTDVPVSFSGELIYDGWSAGFYCSFECGLQQWAHVDGALGGIRIDDFVLPVGEERGQAAALYRNFANAVLSGKRDPFWPEISWKTQQVMDACWRAAQQGAGVTLSG